MNVDESASETTALPARPLTRVTISPWINQRFPPLNEILTAHDVARLTRRPRWILAALRLVGQFPKEQRYRGRKIGWCRSEILAWMSRELSLEDETLAAGRSTPLYCSRRRPRQACLPLDCASLCTPSRSRATGQGERIVR
jgi:predicted DNA-binding transcriptional regulator AlpA